MNSGKQPKIKFAIVGMGHIGKRHMQMIRQNPQAELVAVCDVKTPEECSLSLPCSEALTTLRSALRKQPLQQIQLSLRGTHGSPQDDVVRWMGWRSG